MWGINSAIIDPELVYDHSVSRMPQNAPAQSLRLANNKTYVLGGYAEYDELAATQRLHELQRHDVVGISLTKNDMTKLYTYGLARDVSKQGRPIYDIIQSADSQRMCLYCRVRGVRQLDHFLPKSHYPAYSVSPKNLVPSCVECNSDMKAGDAENVDNMLFHPYFESVEDVRWLKASSISNPTPELTFSVDEEMLEADPRLERICNQFEVLGLNNAFKIFCTVWLNETRYMLSQLLEKAGFEEVRLYLLDLAESAAHRDINSPAALAFAAYAEDEEFCRGSFENI